MAALLDIVKKDSTDVSVTIRVIDSSDGTPETGFDHSTTGIDLWYRREGAAKVSITEAALAALTTAHTDGGVEQIGDGEVRLDLPDAAVATGVKHVDVGGTATGMVVIGGRIRLVDYDPDDAVRAGLTALPNIVAGQPGGLVANVVKKNTDFANIPMLLVLSSDGKTPATGLSPTLTRSLDGAAFGAKNASTTVTEIGTTGVYAVDANAADLNGDLVVFKLSVATADDSFLTIKTV